MMENTKHTSLMASIKSSLEYANSNSEDNLFTPDGKLRRNVNGEILQANEFYLDMVEDLERIKSYWEFIGEDNDIGETESVISDVMELIAKTTNEPKVQQQIRVIMKLERQLEESYTALQAERLERKLMHDEVLSMQADSSIDVDNIVNDEESGNEDETADEKADNEDNEKNSDAQQDCTQKSPDDAKFIKRNIQLAKNSSMSAYSLTDEEKVTLGTLLSDVDNMADTGQKSPVEDDTLTAISGFIFDEDDKNRIHELDKKLLEFCEPDNSATASSFSLIEEADREGKYWKNDDRLKQIDDALRRLEVEIGGFELNRTEVEDELITIPERDDDGMKYTEDIEEGGSEDSNATSDEERTGDEVNEDSNESSNEERNECIILDSSK